MFTSLTTRAKTAIYAAIDRARPAAPLPDKPSALIRIAGRPWSMSIIASVKDVFRRPRPLPDKPSELIRVALADIRLVEADERYVMDMDDWHSLRPHNTFKCHVCVAGAVMAKSLKAHRLDHKAPRDYPHDVKMKLIALDFFRQGNVNLALAQMGLPTVSSYKSVYITDYDTDREEFHTHMNELADKLETIGL